MKAAKSKVESPKKGVVVGDKSPTEVYAGAGSNVVKEAKERKKGGACNYKKGGDVEGKMAMKRLDRPGRAKRADGGKIGANDKPLSTAAHTSNRPGGDVQEA